MTRNKQRVCGRPVIAKDEQGYILVMSLLMLVVLSLMGTAAMTVRNTEVSIATNAEIIQHNFYALEAVTLEGTTEIDKIDDDVLRDLKTAANPPSWLKPNDPDGLPADIIDLRESGTWDSAKINPNNTGLNKTGFDITPPGYVSATDRIQYAAVQGNLHSDPNQYDVCAGSDLSDPTKREGCFSVYGMYDVRSGAGKAYSGRRMLMVGYKKTIYLNP